jgi:aspartate oxidase
VEAGPRVIERLRALGVDFDRSHMDADGGGYDLGREGGHSKRRILHAQDFTGREIERALLQRVRDFADALPALASRPVRIAIAGEGPERAAVAQRVGEAGMRARTAFLG